VAVTLNLPAHLEQLLAERAAGVGQTVEQFLQALATREVMSSSATEPKPEIGYPPGMESPEVWVTKFREWAASHPRVDHFVDDSRESIYEGRGE
jgi:hypothetical protein